MNDYHLTIPQKNIWNLQKYYGDTSIANICGAVFYREKRNSALLQRSIRLFIQNQSGIRLRFTEENEPHQYIYEENEIDIPIMSFSSMEDFESYAEDFIREPIGLMNRPMYRFVVFQMENRSGILVALSHLISDAWTCGLMVNQFDKAYNKMLNNTDETLAEGNYTDYIQSEDNYLCSERYKKDKKYWEEKYTVCPEKSLIKIGPSLSASVKAKRITRVLPLSLEQNIAKYCQTCSVTPAVLFEMGIIIYLSKINSENKEIIIGVPMLNRSNIREKNIAGMFVSTMPLTAKLKKGMTVSELARQIAIEHIDIFRHQKYPYADILKYLREKQNFSGNLYDVMVSYQNARTDAVSDTIWYSNGYSEVPFALHIDNRDGKDSHTINVDYQTSVFKEEAEIGYIIDRLEYIIMQIVGNGNSSIESISILPEQEWKQVVYEFNDTSVDYQREKCVHEFFTEQAQKVPDKVALIFEEKQFTYRQLDEMSNSLAHFLREKGVKRNDVVPIVAKRSWHVIVAMLGVLKAGGAYMLIDYQYPMERISYLVQECKSDIVLTYNCTYNNGKCIDLELVDYWKNAKLLDMVNILDDALCAIHTSGSTGVPKVAVLTHRNIMHYINYSEDFFDGINQTIATTIITFDAFNQETIVALCRQVSVVLLNDIQMANQMEYENVINKYENSSSIQTPTKLLTFIRNSKTVEFLAKIKKFAIGGEVFPQELYDEIKVHNPNSHIYNIYGPTETTIYVTSKRLERNESGFDITIGTPIANTQIYILDWNQKPVPIGVAGELCIAGDGVGKGYLNRTELTAERFIPNPFATKENGHGKTMYRTGDLARFRPDGEIEYLGRIDTQVKIRGLRIELGEIESVMGSFPGIHLNAVTDKRDENDRQYLVGYYTAEGTIDERELRQYLSVKLPKYMVPNYFVHLDDMPMTSSGKVDRKNLPLPDFAVQMTEYVTPETEAEKKLAAIWQELLQTERVGRTDDFFELGGNSLLAITMLSRLEEEFRTTVSMKDIIEHSTLGKLAQIIAETNYMDDEIVPHHKERYVLLPQQKAIYAVYSKQPETLAYNMPARIALPDFINKERLKNCIKTIVNKHQSLKTYILVENDEIYGVYDLDADICFEEYTRDTISDFLRPFDLGKAPLIRIGFAENEFLFDMHHIIADGTSLKIMLKDILRAYSGEGLSDSKIQYSDYVEYFMEKDFAPHRDFFKKMLKCEFEPVFLPEKKELEEPTGISKVFFLTEAVVRNIKSFAVQNELTDTMVYFGAFEILLSKYTAKPDVLTSIILTNRLHKKVQDVVGMFVNTIPVYLLVKGSVKTFFAQLKERILSTYEYQELPFWEIAETVGMKDRSVINTSFVYQGDGEKTLNFGTQELEIELIDAKTAKFDLSMEVTPLKSGCKVRLEYNCAKYEEKLIDDLFAAYERILVQLSAAGTENIEDISALSKEEQHKVLIEFNYTSVNYQRKKCVHELFTEQAQKMPDKVALVFGERKFTYRQLDEMSNSLAHFLRRKGVKRNDVVPIIAKRSWHVIVAMLGVLKAGGAYMPIAPDYPEDRIGYMLETTESKLALLYGYNKSLSIEQIDLDDLDYFYNAEPLENRNLAEDLCYVLYTSGTTGAPKGIGISHRNLVNFMADNQKNEYQHYAIKNGSIMLASTTFIFDISVFEIYLSLLNGLSIVMANDDEINSPHLIAKLIGKYSVDILHCTPTKLAMLLNNDISKNALKAIKVVMTGAEELTSELYHKISTCTDAAIFNGYGPTEITIGASFKKVEGKKDITIGTPIANTQIYILDRNQNPVPISVAGELCIAGDGVGKGYLNRPELTAERFIPNPFATKENGHGKTMYRTGDLARFRSDGEIEYLGRIDTQVKIRGLRIELGEIESVMSSFSGIQLCAVTDKRNEDGRQYLVGYYTAEETIDERELRQHLSAKLPKYMIPNYFVRLDEMPVTSSVKIDRKNLPLPDFAAQVTEYVMPETETEKKLAAIWQELLQINRVGKMDDFFEFGGDSLLAIMMLSKLEEEFQITVSMKDIIEHSTLAQLAKAISEMEHRDSKIIPQYKDSYIILPQQKAIYIACSKSLEMMLYNIPTYISLSPVIDREKLKFCIEKTVDRHKSLKTYFSVEKDEIYGIYDASAKIIFEEYSNQTMSDFFRPFDLNKAPLIRVGFTEDKLLFDIHHIIADGESLNVILKDIFHEYRGEKIDTPKIQYSDYAIYFAEADFTAHKEFFKEMLKCDLEPMPLPEKKILTESGGMSKTFFLSESIVKNAKVYARKNGLTDTMLYFGAFGVLLAKYTAREDILTSVVLTNRQHKELKDVVGMFVNTLPAHFAVKGRTHDFFMQIKELVLNLFKYQELPFLEIAEAVGIREKAVINTSFVYQAGGEKALKIGDGKFLPEFVETYSAKFDLSMEVMPSKEGCKVRLEYNCAKYEERLIDDLFAAYERILVQLSEVSTENVEDISALSSEEQHKILVEFNDTSVDYQREKCIHELFTEWAQKVPDKVALVFEDRQFTYKQLDEMSNSLAYFLREKGTKRNDVVPIVAKRSWHVLVAMLGVLKAGGAFMLIDCQYPMERITYLVNECKADIVLSYGCDYGKNSIDLASVDYREDVEVLDTANQLEDVLCVIHTSGSSGVPKVSLLTHGNILHYIHYSAEFFDGVDQAIAATIITFDAFIQETIVALCRQVPVILLNDVQITNQAEFERIINKYEDSFLFQTPTRFLSCIRNSKSGKFINKLRKIIIGGEVFPQELYDEIKLSNPESDIYNIYGPTETTICVTVKKIDCGTDITIGTPIANTQIYILDQNQKPVPIGVTGELCIAGDGVGKGYLNRPELTAERFIPNPFATKENGHGKTMYRTGDLARFRSDGEIEYLGRIDTQVKIRGLRIELGEIESVMSSFPGIQLCAVTDKRNEDGRQYLVGYYTAEGTIDERELRQYLSAKLPKYMVPNYFIHLNEMPMTSSGKIDRKELPLPDFTVNNSVYAAPETEQEKLCCDILAELLGYEQIGVEDDFFEIGGDSLRAIEYTAKLHDKGVNLALQNVFDYPTVRKLCDFLESGEVKKVKYQAADFDRYYEMISRNVIDETFMPKKRGLGNVLLTGVTGFLGIHVLDGLMSEESGIIYCLVRSKEKEECLKRIQGILQYYFGDKYESELGNRIIPIEGDIEREGLAEDIPLDVHTVIHTAATVKHYGSYEYFYRVNVEGTRHVADYAKSVGAKMIHISTLSVSGNSMLDELTVYRSEEEKIFYETSFFIGQPLDNVYIHSKFEAEKVIYDAMLDGLDAKVIRVGNLTNRIADFKFQPNYTQNAFLTRVKAILEFGLFPDYLMPLYTEFSPVDLTAEGIVKIAQYAERQNVFHLNSNRPIYYDRLFEILHQLGIPMKVLDGNAFYKALRQTMKDMGTEYIYEALQNDMDEDGRLVYDSNIRIVNDFTVWFLKKVGFEWKEIDLEYIRGYIEYFREIGFLKI